ncbi:hypothetical protein Bbelb_440000, partial [Branchiostoma belcheri]
MTVYRVAVTEKKYRTFSCDQLQRRVSPCTSRPLQSEPRRQLAKPGCRSSGVTWVCPGGTPEYRHSCPNTDDFKRRPGRPGGGLADRVQTFDRQRSGEYSVSQAISSPGGLARTLQYSTRDRDWQVSGPSRRLLSVLVGTWQRRTSAATGGQHNQITVPNT